MPVVIDCLYRAGGAEARLKIREEHLEYIIAQREQLLFGGPSVIDGRVVGMLLVLASDNPTDARRFMEHEPYARAGLFSQTRYTPFQTFVPEPREDFLTELLASARTLAEQLRSGMMNRPDGG